MYYIIWLVHKLGAQKSLTDVHVCVPLSFFHFVVHLDCIGASRCLVTPKLGRQQQQCQGESGVESHFKLTFHYWQPPFDHSTITFNNFISLDYHLNFQAFCKSLPFSFQRQVPVYSPFAICCRRSVNVTLPSSLFFLLLYSFFFFTFSSSSHPLHSLLLAHAIFFQHLSKEMALFSFSVLLVDFSTVSTFAVRTKYNRTAIFFRETIPKDS